MKAGILSTSGLNSGAYGITSAEIVSEEIEKGSSITVKTKVCSPVQDQGAGNGRIIPLHSN